jgi:hypothetical protein
VEASRPDAFDAIEFMVGVLVGRHGHGRRLCLAFSAAVADVDRRRDFDLRATFQSVGASARKSGDKETVVGQVSNLSWLFVGQVFNLS